MFSSLHSHRSLDSRIRVILHNGNIFVSEVEKGLHVFVQDKLRQFSRLTCELFARLFNVIAIQMHIAECLYEFPNIITAYVRQHMRQKSITGDIKRHPKKKIRTALVELAGKSALSIVIGSRSIELKETMTRRQFHLRYFGHVPRTHKMATRIGITLKTLKEHRYLIMKRTVFSFPPSPLFPIDRTQISILIRPLIPNFYVIFLQIFDVRLSLQKPQELMHDRPRIELLCCK